MDQPEAPKRADRPVKLSPGLAYLLGISTALFLWVLFYLLAVLIPAMQTYYRAWFCRAF